MGQTAVKTLIRETDLHRPLAAQNHWPAGAQQHSGTTHVRSGRAFAAVRRAAPFELEPRAPERRLDGRQGVRQDAEAPAHRWQDAVPPVQRLQSGCSRDA